MREHDNNPGGMVELNEHPQRQHERQEAEQEIAAGIEAAAATEQRVIDHRTARLIAQQLHGPDSPLYVLATTGEVQLEQEDDSTEPSPCMLTELSSLVTALPEGKQAWLHAMAEYALSRENDPAPVRGWQQLTGTEVKALTDSTPKIHVIARNDHAGNLVSDWIDADQDPPELQTAIDELLERSTSPDAAAWEIFDSTGFGGLDVFTLIDADPATTLETISRVAMGVAEHGPAFALYVRTFGSSQEICEQFEYRYLGRWASTVAYAQHVADDLAWYENLDRLPQWLRDYMSLDYTKLATHLAQHLTVVDNVDGKVSIFGPQ